MNNAKPAEATALRKEALRCRRLAACMTAQNDPAVQRLNDFASELESRAVKLEGLQPPNVATDSADQRPD